MCSLQISFHRSRLCLLGGLNLFLFNSSALAEAVLQVLAEHHNHQVPVFIKLKMRELKITLP